MKTKGAFSGGGGFFSELVSFGAQLYTSEQEAKRAAERADRDAEIRRAEIEANAENVALVSQRRLVRNIAIAGGALVAVLLFMRSRK